MMSVLVVFLILFCVSVDPVHSSGIYNVAVGPNSLQPDNKTALEDNDTSTCATFGWDHRGVSKFRIDLSLSQGNSFIEVEGQGLECSTDGALYLVALTPAQTTTWFDRWRTCSPMKMQMQNANDICRFDCFCEGICPKLQVYHRPQPHDTTQMVLCDIRHKVYRDCQEIKEAGCNQDGIYAIDLNGQTTQVLCNMTSDGGGWTVLLLRKNGSGDFNRNWSRYQHGFGDLSGEFWLGNEKMHQLTSDGRNYILSIEGISFGGRVYKAKYDHFTIADETMKYRLGLGTFLAGSENILRMHMGHSFSTLDQDNDIWNDNCAYHYRGGWWYHNCQEIKLTGHYGSSIGGGHGILWGNNLLMYADMKIRVQADIFKTRNEVQYQHSVQRTTG